MLILILHGLFCLVWYSLSITEKNTNKCLKNHLWRSAIDMSASCATTGCHLLPIIISASEKMKNVWAANLLFSLWRVLWRPTAPASWTKSHRTADESRTSLALDLWHDIVFWFWTVWLAYLYITCQVTIGLNKNN